MEAVIDLADADLAVERAVAALRAEELVVAPTDTVYALLADAFSRTATRKLARAKRRSRLAALSVVIRSPRQVAGLVSEVSEEADRLMASYWPGPLTLVFPAADGLTWDLGQTRGTVALRMPADDLTLAIVKEVGPLACTAANRRGQPVVSTGEEAQVTFADAVSLVIDGGSREAEVSTVVDVTREGAHVLREGAVPAASIGEVARGAVPWGQRPEHEPAMPDGEPAAAVPAQPAAGESAAEPVGTPDEHDEER